MTAPQFDEKTFSEALVGTPVVAAWVFGSRTQGRERADSDTDVACLLPAGTTADLALLQELTLRLERAGIAKPDVHFLGEAPLAFQFEALRGQRVFTRDEAARAAYEAETTLAYLDFEPLLKLQYDLQRRRLAQTGSLWSSPRSSTGS